MDPHVSISDQNVERMLQHAYQPESPDPAFVAGLQERLRTMAHDQAYRQTQEARMSRFRTRMSAFVAVAATVAFVALLVYAQRTIPTRPGASDVIPPPHVKADVPAPITGMIAQAAPAEPALERLAVGGTVTTSAREIQRVELPDGSRVALNADTSIRLESPRRLILERGEVFVEVRPAPGRFLVKTPHREVTALGTKFAVRHQRDKTGVIVTQGKVQVSGFEPVLHAGQQLLPDATTFAEAPRATVALDWARDLLSGSPLVPNSKFTGGALIAFDRLGQEAKISLDRFHLDVHIEDGFARTTIDQTYFNHDYNQLEGTFYFPLPADASISRLAMYVNGVLMEGGMAERGHARDTFEQIRHTRRDPALLEWMDGSTFKMRVFPLEPRQEKRIILSYSQRLANVHGKVSYRFPLGHNLPIVEQWSVHALVKGGALLPWACRTHLLDAKPSGNDLVLSANAKNIKPARDLQLELTDAGVAAASVKFAATVHDGHRYVSVRYRPDLPAATASAKRKHFFVLFETSADRDPLLARTQIEVLRTLLENLEHSDTVAVLAAGTRCRWVQAEPIPATPKNVDALLEKLDQAHLVGALDLGLALTELTPVLNETRDSCLIHVGSGIPVLGEKRDDVLLARLPVHTQYAGVAIGKRWNRTLMKAAAERSGGHFAQIHPDDAVAWRAFDFLATLHTPRLHDLQVTDDYGRTWLAHDSTVSSGTEISAMTAHSENEAPPKRVTVTGHVSGAKFSRAFDIVAASDGKYLPRTWGKLEIDRLVALGAEANKAKIIDLSKRLYVMSPFTSLLVLENDAMYTQFNIDRGRKDHWARYEAPAQVPVVKNAVGPPAPATSIEHLLRSIVVRNAQKPLTMPGMPPTGSRTVWDLLALQATGWGWQEIDDGVSNTIWYESGAADRNKLSEGRSRIHLTSPMDPDKTNTGKNRTERSVTAEELMAERELRERSELKTLTDSLNREALSRTELLRSQAGGFGRGGLGGFGGGGLHGGGLGGGGLGGGGLGGGFGGFGPNSGFAGITGQFGGPPGQPGWAMPGGFPGPGGPGMPGGGMPGFGGTPGGPGGSGMPGMQGSRGPELPRGVDGFGGVAGAKTAQGDRKFDAAKAKELLLLRELGSPRPELELLLQQIRTGQQPVAGFHQVPTLQAPAEVGRDLLAFAPGMDTLPADVSAILASEAGRSSAPGTIDAAARQLIERARAFGWRKLPANAGATVLVDGAGRCVIERTLPLGLTEQIVCNGSTLWHIYPELAVAARRSFSRFHFDDLRTFAPWLVPSAEDLAHGYDLKALDARTVAIVPRGAAGPHRELWLVFGADGRLLEKQIVALPEKKVVVSVSYTAKEFGDAATTPALQPDFSKIVVLPLPYRTSAFVQEWEKRFGSIWLCKAYVKDLSLASSLGEMKNGLQHTGVGFFTPDRQKWHGALTIMRAGGSLAAAGTAASADDALGRYWQWWSPAGIKAPADIAPTKHLIDAKASYSFLQRVADLAYLMQEPKMSMTAHLRWLRPFVERNRSELGVAAIMHCSQRSEMTPEHWMTLAELWPLLNDEPSFRYAARYERMRCLTKVGFHGAARNAFADLCQYAFDQDLPLPLDAAINELRPSDTAWYQPLIMLATKWGPKAPERAMWMASQCRQLGQVAAADAVFAAVQPHLADASPVARMTAAHYAVQTGKLPLAQSLLQSLLNEERWQKMPALWRLAASNAQQRRQTRRFAESLERALDLEFGSLPEAIDVQKLRADYGALLEAYRQLIDAMRQTETAIPADMRAKIIRAIDRWRSLDPDVTTVCYQAARLMRELEAPTLAWEYITSPLATRPNDASPLRQLAVELINTGDDPLAEKALAAAFTVEGTDAQLLWDRAQILQRLGRRDEAQSLFKQLAEGQWQPRFEGLKQQALQMLKR